MKSKCKYKGFSLTEVMMSVGILAVGMIFIAGVFPVAIHFTTIATERTTAAIVADEAFAKVQLYGVNININPASWPGDPALSTDINRTLSCVDFYDVALRQLPGLLPPNFEEFMYPSIPPAAMDSAKQYCWSALCRRVDPSLTDRNVQVTVFVCRMIGTGNLYWARDPADPAGGLMTVLYPVPVVPVWVNINPRDPADPVFSALNADEVVINDAVPADGIDEISFINDGCTIVDNATGRMYRVLERYANQHNIILLDGPWQGGTLPGSVWVVPPPVGGGRYPCIAVYQKEIQF